MVGSHLSRKHTISSARHHPQERPAQVARRLRPHVPNVRLPRHLHGAHTHDGPANAMRHEVNCQRIVVGLLPPALSAALTRHYTDLTRYAP